MMKSFFKILFAFLLLASCTADRFREGGTASEAEEQVAYGDVAENSLRVKLAEVPKDSSEIIALLNGIAVKSIHPTFPNDPRFAGRHHEAGLDLWYDVTFEQKSSATKAAGVLSGKDGISLVERIRRPHPSSLPFNDPLLANQWHYENDGSLKGSVAGCDINLFDAWAVTTGSENVIVAVTDIGVMYDHEDLATNMWVNEAEFNGQKGVDDDGNGYVDDIYGYNFVAASTGGMKGKITPGDHGTHVAGTIAAVNGNSKGVCGIAGGNGTKRGTSIMCCQIMDDTEDGAYIAASYVYAADNGAVISQNSWSLDQTVTSLPESIKAGIDYFVKYAGTDSLGLQSGPMMGGLVTFAAGNDNTDHSQPSEYEKVMAVAALAADFKKAYYSNYGSWVDISAPGGDYYKGHDIWSTVLNDEYLGKGWQGTSMACPHVSGVAALVVDRYGKKGFTCDMLKEILLLNTTDIYQYSPSLKGQMGSGLVNAFKCLQSSGPNPPEKVSGVVTSAKSNTITLGWKVPVDPDDGKASFFDIYYANQDISDISPQSVPQYVTTMRVSATGKEAGDSISVSIEELNFETDYYFRINALDAGANESGLSTQVKQKTGSNTAPVIEALDGVSVSIKPFQTTSLRFKVYDPDGHPFTCSLVAGNAVKMTVKDSLATLTFTGKNESAGEYQAVLTAKDKYNASSTVTVQYVILPNTAPEVVAVPENMVFGETGVNQTVKMSDYIKDADGETLTFSAKKQSSGKLVVETSVDGDVLTIRSKSSGYADITFTGEDIMGEECSVTFKVLVRDGSQAFDMYPSPVQDYMYLRTENKETVSVSVYSSAGTKVFGSDLATSPFEPGKIDMRQCPGGVYSVTVTRNSEVTTRNIVKL